MAQVKAAVESQVGEVPVRLELEVVGPGYTSRFFDFGVVGQKHLIPKIYCKFLKGSILCGVGGATAPMG